jgi:DNA-binding MarR family transcriptional regulator
MEFLMVGASLRKTMSDYDLWALLDATGFAISRLRQLELSQINLTLEQVTLLRFIHTMNGVTTVRKIKEAMLRQQNTISINVNRMAKMGLVTIERKSGERESKIRLTDKGFDMLETTPNISLEAVFAVLTIEDKQSFAYTLSSLLERARNMLVPDMPPFMRYIGNRISQEKLEIIDEQDDRFSSYRLWMSLDTVRFALSRLRELELDRFGLTVEQSSVLKVLVDRGASVKSKDLENAMLRQHHSISTLVNRMMRVNLVAKERKPGEKSDWIFITDQGKSLFGRITTAAIDVTLCILSESEKEQLSRCLHSLYKETRHLLGVPGLPYFTPVPS